VKVVHLVSGDLWAGAEAATFELLRALRKIDGIDASAIVLNPGTLAERLAAADVPVDIVPELEHSFPELRRAIRHRTGDADLLHAHRYKESLLAAFSGLPWVSTQHGRPEPFSGAARLRAAATSALDLAVKRLSGARVIGVSGEVSQWLAPRVGPRKVVTIANGIADPHERVAAPPWSERARRVGFLGRLVPVKRPLFAIECIAHCPDIELDVVGDGPLREQVRARVEELDLSDRVQLRGHVDDPLPLVAGWRSLISTSVHEGHPISVLEALSLGTPVVFCANGVGDAVGPEAGRAVDAAAPPRHWAPTLASLVTDAAAGLAASAAARRRFVECFDVRGTAARTVAVYREVLGRA